MMTDDNWFRERLDRASADRTAQSVRPDYRVGQRFPLIEDAFKISGSVQDFEVTVESVATGAEWYVVRTAPKLEDKVEQGIKDQGFEAYQPRTKIWRAVKRPKKGQQKKRAVTMPLFTGYLFGGFARGAERHFKFIREVVGVQGFVTAQNTPLLVPEHIVDAIKELEEAGTYDYTRDRPAQPKPKRGSVVSVTDGPFKGLSGIVDATPGERVKILLKMLGRVDVGLDQVEGV